MCMKGLEQYDVRLLLALVKSVEGRTDFFKVLVSGPHPELAAFSNACDGDEKAIEWIGTALPRVNLMFALAVKRNEQAIKWLYANRLEIFLMLARETEKFLDYQDKEYAWPYVMHFGGHVRAAEELTKWKNKTDNNDTEERQQQTDQGE